MKHEVRQRGGRRLLGWIARGFGLLLIGVTLLVVVVLLAINLPPVSALLVSKVNAALAGSFRGRVVLHRIEHLSFAGVGGAELEVFDPAGHAVLRAEGTDVWLSVPAVAYHAIFAGKDPLRIPIEKIDVRRVRVTLFDDGTGTPTLAQAFEPQQPPPASIEPAAPPELSVAHVTVGKVEVRGALGATGPIEVDLTSLGARLASGARGLELAVQQLEVEARRLPRVRELSGRLSGGVFLPKAIAETPQSPADPAALGTQTYALRPAPPPERVDLKFDGQVAGSGTALQLHLLGAELHAALDAPEVSRATLGELAPGLQSATPLGLSAQLDGSLEALDFEARLRAADARATLRGRARLRSSELERVTARLEGSDFDLSQLSSGAPVTRLRFTADAEFDGAREGGHGSYRLLSKGSKLSGVALPDLDLEGQFQVPRTRPLHTKGTLKLAEPGAPLDAEYEIDAAEAVSARLTAKLELARPARLRALTGVSAAGSLVANLRFDGGSEQLDADLGLRLRQLTHPRVKLGRLSAALVARGGLHAPELRASLDANQLEIAGRSLQRFWLRAEGTPERLKVKAHATGRHPDQVDVYALLAPGSKRLVRAPFILVTDGPDRLSLAMDHIDVEPHRFRVAGFTLGGPGSARASLVYGRRLEQLDLETQALDIARVLSMFGIATPLKSAEADLVAHVSTTGHQPSGKLTGELRDLDFAGVSGTVRADLSLDRGQIDGTLGVEATDVGNTQVTLEHVPATLQPPSLRELETERGKISVGGELDLERLGTVLPLLGVERGEGHVRYQLSVGRTGPGEGLPAFQAHVESRGLVLVGQREDPGQQHADAERARQAAPWSLRGMDLNVDATFAEQQAELRGRFFDEHGELAHFAANLRDLSAPRDGSSLAQHVLHAPFEAQIQVPERAVASWPEAIRPTTIEGSLALDLDAHGSLADPTVAAHARARGFAASRETGGKQPARLDLALDANYAPTGGELSVKALRGTRVVSTLKSNWSGDARRLAGPLDGASPIRATVDLGLDAFPLEVVPEFATRELRGELTGRARLDGLGKDARLDLSLSSHDLALARLALGEFETTLHGGGGTLDLRTRLSGRAGKVSASVSLPLSWADRLVPATDGQMQGSFETEGLQLRMLQPLVEGSVGQLGGKLDSSFTAARADGEMRVSGHATLTEGVVDVPSVGQRLSDIGAEVTLSPGELRIDKLHARGISGGFEGSVQAELDGLMPRSAQASLRIKESDKLPIAVQGETLGEVWGNIEAHYQQDLANQTQSVDVDLQKLEVELPATPPRGIATLEQPKYIRVGYFRRDDQFIAIDLQPLDEAKPPSEQKTVVSVNLKNVTIRKADQARVVLGGKVDATLGSDLDVQGTIEARGGELDVSGKTFDIERGTVSFTGGSPDDPTINAVARYDAPAGYTVYAEYVGTARKGKLNLRAEPTLTQDEIVTLLLFGSPDGSLGSGNGDSLSTAVSVAGGAAAQSLNRAISDVTSLDVSARVDTSTGAPRPELVLQLTPGTAAKVTQALGQPAPGESPDRTFLTLDLRLASTWSLSTTVGDRGASALDLIWRHRY